MKNVITKSKFVAAAEKYPQYANAIMDAYDKLVSCDADTSEKLKAEFPSLDKFKYIDKHWVIDISGGLRCVMIVWFSNQHVRVVDIFSHAEYDAFTEKHRRKGKKARS
ncbi:TPA: type II toxin-antitoxin system HigB family toxin [Vibrio parahaemolyticus]|nr:type II toxin-antitoxin system HigB family toxin [Vibrio parahaemolyticus]